MNLLVLFTFSGNQIMNQFNGQFMQFYYIYSTALALHNINGEPFSVTFATAGKLLNQTGLPP
jgi:hypothetical protein